ncbi:MAG TPA: FecR family protein [Pyrinomonadaceae bacterium]|nr:FecR family protein [Pyrinomonadaceae bacterium]
MKKGLMSLIPLLVASFVVAFPFSTAAQNREKFVISAHAGGVNAVTGRAALRSHGTGDWQQLTITEDLETGDVVRTSLDGRVEVLLNPGSYLRIGENSEIELTDNSLENLEIRLVRGTAIVEVTGTDDTELLINIATPHTRMAIVRRGLYRVNVVPGDATELIVRKGRVLLEPTHTKIKGGDKVIFSDNSFSVAKLKKGEKTRDDLEAWSKGRAETLTQANSRLSARALTTLIASYRSDWWLSNFSGRAGFWLYDSGGGFYTFFPFSYGCGSPYGTSYGSSLYGTIYRNPLLGWSPSGGSGGAGSGTGNGVGSGAGGGNPNNVPPPPANPISESPRARDIPTAGPANAHRPDNP